MQHFDQREYIPGATLLPKFKAAADAINSGELEIAYRFGDTLAVGDRVYTRLFELVTVEAITPAIEDERSVLQVSYTDGTRETIRPSEYVAIMPAYITDAMRAMEAEAIAAAARAEAGVTD